MLKSKNSNKAFTLIELLGVIILLAVIAIIALIAVNKNIKDTENTLKQVQLNNIKDGAKNWSTDNIKSIPDGKTIYLTLAQLKQGGYVEENIKSPGNDKLCFPNDLQIEIKSNDTGSYEYNVFDNNITYVSCEEDNLDSNAPRIVLTPGAEKNDKNEVVDYVEVSQDQDGSYTVPVAFAYKDSSDYNGEFRAEVTYTIGENVVKVFEKTTTLGKFDENDKITLNDIKIIGRIYKITYTIEYDDENNDKKYVSAVRNIIIRDTTAPEITINKTEDTTLYYTNSSNEITFIPYSFTLNNFTITDNSGTNNINYTIEGEKKINDYFNSLNDISNYLPKEFPIVITATDDSGNSSKKSQNIKINIKQARGPIIKLYNNKSQIYYENSADDGVITSYDSTKWLDDYSLNLEIESGCQIDREVSYYKYGNTTKNFTEFNSPNYISIPIDTIEGKHNFEVYAKCSEEGLDGTAFPNIEVKMDSTELKVDHVAPACSITLDKEPDGSNGWYKTNPVITFKIEDFNGISEGNLNDSNLAITNGKYESSQSLNDGTYTYTLNGKDVAGRTCTAIKTIKVDTTPPQISGTPSVANIEQTYHVSFTVDRYRNESNVYSQCKVDSSNNCIRTSDGLYYQFWECSNEAHALTNNTIKISKISIRNCNRGSGSSTCNYASCSNSAIGIKSNIQGSKTLNVNFTFKSNAVFKTTNIAFSFPKKAGEAGICNRYRVTNFKFRKCLSEDSSCEFTSSDSRDTYGGSYTCAGCASSNGLSANGCLYRIDRDGNNTARSVLADTVGEPGKQIKVTFFDSSSTDGVEKSCYVDSNNSCEIEISDEAGNSIKYTCSSNNNGTATCS